MRPDGKDAAYLWDMVEAAKTALDLTAGYDVQRYLANRTLQLAIERLVEVIGEAANRVSAAFREAHPEVPWRRIISQRHVLAHEYGEIRQGQMWLLVSDHIPKLVTQLEPLLPPPPPEPEG
ncbi:MAG: DUF86 domain-containing protein [Armatimonadota bacterium]